MSTFAEIESAVDALPRPEKLSLLNRLSRQLASDEPQPAFNAEEVERRRAWLAELRELREKSATGKQGIPLQQLLDELRADPC